MSVFCRCFVGVLSARPARPAHNPDLITAIPRNNPRVSRPHYAGKGVQCAIDRGAALRRADEIAGSHTSGRIRRDARHPRSGDTFTLRASPRRHRRHESAQVTPRGGG